MEECVCVCVCVCGGGGGGGAVKEGELSTLFDHRNTYIRTLTSFNNDNIDILVEQSTTC